LPARPILFLPALLLAYLLLPTLPAHAAEKRMMGDVTVGEGETTKEVRTAWGDVVVEGNVENDVESAFGNIWVEGPVGGDVDAGSGEVHINAPVGGNVDVGHGDVYLENGAQVKGDVSHHSGRLYLHPGALVGGPQKTGMASGFDDRSLLETFLGTVGWTVLTLGFVAAAVLLAVAAPGPLRASARSLEAAPGRSLVLGLGSLPAMIVLSVLLAITVVGGLLIPLLWPAYVALVLFGALVAAYFLGRKIVLATGRYRAGDALAAAVGALLVSAACLIPFLGGLVFAILALLGTGAAVSALLARRPSGASRATHASYEDYLRERR
ncbi:MAG TPA: polymer-forming cytoskeletal protein, partial [Rubrobacteraceae bacterium]|nr:polymer-forming cytoskeletal protein [Rubrobacteraceae bacterium]